MKRIAIVFAGLFSLLAFGQPSSAARPDGDYLSAAELVDGCAEALPKQLACKEDFCAAMVDIRKKHQPKFASVDRKEMIGACLAEIAVDGTGDLETRRGRCRAWSKDRPPMKLLRADATAMDACFSRPTCEARIACWAPYTDKQMAALEK